MIKQAVLEQNMQIYLQKMEEKFTQNAHKLTQLQQTIHNAAKTIQVTFRRYLLRKKTRAALRIQRAFRKFIARIRYREAIIEKFRRFYASYKIYYFLKSKSSKKKVNSNPTTAKKLQKPKNKTYSLSILHKIKSKSKQFIILLSSLQAEISYIRKYMLYDRKNFTQSWQIYEKKQREWMWEQIRKKWVKKGVEVWINQQQKQVNAEKYVNAMIEQGYLKYLQKYEAGQKRLQRSELQLKNRITGLTKAFYFSIMPTR